MEFLALGRSRRSGQVMQFSFLWPYSRQEGIRKIRSGTQHPIRASRSLGAFESYSLGSFAKREGLQNVVTYEHLFVTRYGADYTSS